MSYKLTKQGVRDLGSSRPTKKEQDLPPPTCDHSRMKEKQGHFHCPDCDVYWDEGFEGA